MSDNSSNGCTCSAGPGCLNVLPATITAMVGYHIHQSIFWAIIDWLLWPFVVVKWIIYHEITLTIIRETFSWFFR